jgi:type VI secretion system protein ImpJ
MRVMKKDDTYFATNFIPPQLSVSRNSALGGLCMEIIQHIREKVSFLTDKVQNPSVTSPDGDFSIALRTLIATLIPFEAMLYSEHNGPFELYLGLCTIAGQISSLNPGLTLPSFAPYNHKNLRSTFEQVTIYCHQTLDQIQETYKIVRFDQEERVFRIKLPQPWIASTLSLGVEIHQNFGENEAMEWLKSSIIGSENYLRGIRDKRVLGAPRSINLSTSTFKNASGNGILMASIQLTPEYTDPLHPLIVTNISDTIEKRPKALYLYVEHAL